MIKITIPMKNGSKIEVEGDLKYVKETVTHLPEVLDVMKTAVNDVQPIAIGSEISVPVLQPESSGSMPMIEKSGNFADTLEKLMRTEWGRTPRTLPEVEETLKTSGEFRAKATVAGTLLSLVKQGKLRRIRESNKDMWKYVPA